MGAPWGSCRSGADHGCSVAPSRPSREPLTRRLSKVRGSCCFVLLVPTPEEYRVPRVSPGVTASKTVSAFTHSLLLHVSLKFTSAVSLASYARDTLSRPPPLSDGFLTDVCAHVRASSNVTHSHACVSSCTSKYTRSHVLSVLTGQDRRDDNHLGMLVWLRTGAPARWARELRPHQRCWVIDRQFALQFGYALHNNDHAMQKEKGRVDRTNHLLLSEADLADGRAQARQLVISKSFAFAVDKMNPQILSVTGHV
jgi:hypothetical protein